MTKKENQRVTLTKQLLKNALIRLLKQKELRKISVSELCEEAGINRTTFYLHYGSQYDVLDEVAAALLAQLQERLTQENAGQQGAVKDIERQFEIICTFLYENSELVCLLLRNDINSTLMETLFQFPAAPEMISQHLSHQYDGDSKKLLNTFFITGGYSLIRQWLMEDIAKSPQQVAQLLVDITINGWEMHGN